MNERVTAMRLPTNRRHAAPRLRAPAALPVTAIALVALLLAIPGCGSPAKSSPKPKPGASARSEVPDPGPDAPGRRTAPIGGARDECADRLHALSGPLLFYYAVNRRLPLQVDELREFAGPDPIVEFTCPVSGKPYLYDPRGLPRGGGKPGFIVLCDPEPTHSGMRLAITVEEPKSPTQPLITHVVAEPEVTFHDAPPPPAPAADN